MKALFAVMLAPFYACSEHTVSQFMLQCYRSNFVLGFYVLLRLVRLLRKSLIRVRSLLLYVYCKSRKGQVLI